MSYLQLLENNPISTPSTGSNQRTKAFYEHPNQFSLENSGGKQIKKLAPNNKKKRGKKLRKKLRKIWDMGNEREKKDFL